MNEDGKEKEKHSQKNLRQKSVKPREQSCNGGHY